MVTRNGTLVFIAFFTGVIVFLVVSAVVPEDRWTVLHWWFVGLAKVSMERLISPEYVSVHAAYSDAIAAGLHGSFVALILLLAYRLGPRLRQNAWLTLAILLITDTTLMVLAFRAGPD